MNNPYFLPICLAAAAHGALLFGFNKNPRVPKLPAEITTLVQMVMPRVEDEPPVVVDADRAETPPKSAPDVQPPPRSPEPPLPIDTGAQPTMQPPPIQPISTDELRHVVESSIGVIGGPGKASWGNIVGEAFLDNPPRTRFQASPLYPYQGKRDGVSGEVLVDFVVDERGRVVEPRVVKSSHTMFDEPTLRAVAKWQFEPGRREGKIVKFRMTVPVVFNLHEGS